MTLWVSIAAMCLVATLFVAWPLYRRQQRLSLLIAGCVAVIVAISLGLYAYQGRPGLPSGSGTGEPPDSQGQALRSANAEVMSFSAVDGRVDADEVLQELAVRGVNEVMVEAGPGLSGHLLARDLVDELVIYQAPHIMGSQTMGLVDTPSWEALADRQSLTITDVRRIGGDTRITATPGKKD